MNCNIDKDIILSFLRQLGWKEKPINQAFAVSMDDPVVWESPDASLYSLDSALEESMSQVIDNIKTEEKK